MSDEVSKEVKYSEILRLKEMLEKANIPFDFSDRHFDGYHLCYPARTKCVCSVIELEGSYGYRENLLEISGLTSNEELEFSCDTVLGSLTAENVFERISKHYKSQEKES